MPIEYIDNFPDPKGKIHQALDAVGAIPFSSWKNRNIQNALLSGVIALAYDYKDPRRTEALLHVIGELQKELADGVREQFKDMQGAAQRVTYYVTGELKQHSSFIRPDEEIFAVMDKFRETQQAEEVA